MPIPISKFEEHVAKMHQERDQGFGMEYDVRGMFSIHGSL